MKALRVFTVPLLALWSLCLAGPVFAQWDLDSTKSTIHFISIKNGGVGEVHRFDEMIGFVSPRGDVNVSIDLDSVETLVPIRNDRMRDMLFETAKFPTAHITASVDESILAAVKNEGTLASDMQVTLELHGVEQQLQVPVVVSGDADGGLRVLSRHPVIVRAPDFGLAGGIDALRDIVGLDAIATAVPVTVDLVFNVATR